MRNGTRSNKLTLVNGDAQATSDASDTLRPTHDAPLVAVEGEGRGDRDPKPSAVSPALVLFAVSVACGTAAVVAGSYAFWLTRQQAARQTLTDVQDILKRCQERMHQMEDDLNHLPGGMTSLLS